MEDNAVSKPTFLKFRPACKAHNIGATKGYELVTAGLLKTFKIGSGTYIEVAEFSELPKRLQDPAAQERLAAAKRNSGQVSRGAGEAE